MKGIALQINIRIFKQWNETEAVHISFMFRIILKASYLKNSRVKIVGGNRLITNTAVSPTEFALNATDFLLSPAWIIGGVLLWRREALGYVTGLGLLFQASMLFVGLVFVLILRPFLTTAEFLLGDVLVVLAMGMVCFVPFALYLRGTLYRRNTLLG